ncbi:MAG: efflux RND transporter periplasmic adaptor subunit [Pirellulaceae bacterium]|nr:efflux RND transporter periplasmic adaptor subunit [Pirellulaceae bacterium]
MKGKNFPGKVRALTLTVLACGAVASVSNRAAAHENHAPLPTRGVTIAGDTIMLSDKAREAIGLTTAKIEFGDIHRTVTVNARVELPWYSQAMITTLVAGRIDDVLVRPGETVAPGQELARVVSTELKTLQLELVQAAAEVELARKLVDQQTALDLQGVIPGKMLLESQARLAEASAVRQIARQKLAALGVEHADVERIERQSEWLPYIPILSPTGGVVTHADVRIGQMVRPVDHLYHVVDLSTLWIIGEVLESDIRLLAEGQQIEADFAALPGRRFHGKIDHLGLSMNSQTRTQEVVIAIDNKTRELRPGMFGRVRISVEVVKEAIVCPDDAIIRSRSGNYLLVQRLPGKYENRKVNLGLTDKGLTEVLDSVFPGDHVVVVGNSLLAALLGNEHKARVDTEAPGALAGNHPGVIATAHGTVELPLDRQALATVQVEGRVRRILVKPGQDVSPGDVLAEIDSLPLRSVQLDLLQTRTQAALAEQSLQRLEELHEQGVVAKRQRWELESRQQSLRAKAEMFERQLIDYGLEPDSIEKLKQADLSESGSLTELIPTLPVRSPAAGQIAGFHVVPGQVVHPQEAMFEIHDLTVVWVKGFIYERDANRVLLGQPARIHFTAYPHLEAHGQVVRISPLMDERMRVLPVWIEVGNPDRRLKSGMLARIAILEHSAADIESRGAARLSPIPSKH